MTVARNDAAMVSGLLRPHVVPQNRSHGSSRDDAAVAGFEHLRSGHGDDAAHIDAAVVEQAADDGEVLHVYRPDDLALIDGVDVVDLHAHVARGVLAREFVDFSPLKRRHLALAAGPHREVHLARGEATHDVDTGLEVFPFAPQHEVVIGGQGRGIERRNEYGLRNVVRVGNDAIGTLHDHGPQARTQQLPDDLLPCGGFQIDRRELLVSLGRIGLDGHVEHFAFLSAIDRRHRAADRRGKEHPLVVLIEEQRRACLHPVTDLNQQLGRHALEVERRDGVLPSHRQIDELLGSLSQKIDVETLA